MRTPNLLLTAIACTGLLAIAYALPVQASSTQSANPDSHSSQSSMDNKEITATVVSVDPQTNTIRVKELGSPIAVTSNTQFDTDVQMDKLKPGDKVTIRLNTASDGTYQAAEVRKPK